MNPYGQTFTCECGNTHTIDPQLVICEPNAVEKVVGTAAKFTSGRKVAVLCDTRTHAVAGATIVDRFLADRWSLTTVILPDPSGNESPVCSKATHDEVAAQVSRADIIVAVGSGVVNDLGKWTAVDLDVPYISFATAASMNGYTSANIAIAVEGVKTVKDGRPPKAVLADPGILGDAPYEMTTAGLGDIVAKSVSTADWRMNHLIFGDYYCDRSASLIADIEPLYAKRSADLLARKPDALADLFEGLLLTGVAMTMVETSAPASGGEHLISHTLDMICAVRGVRHDLHGRQVGVGTILASELYRRVLEIESPEFVDSPAQIDREYWGSVGDAVAKQYAPKGAKMAAAKDYLSTAGNWDTLRDEVSGFHRTPDTIRTILKEANAACEAEHIERTREDLFQALVHAREMRTRFTILDLAWMVGVLPGQAGEIVASLM